MRIDETPGAAGGKEQKLTGIGVSPGIAIGPAYIGDRGQLPVSESRIAETDLEAERARFAEAVAASAKQLRKLKSRATALPGSAADEIGYVLDAHLAMLANSRLIRHRLKKPYAAYSGWSGGAISLAEEVPPADTALMDPRRIGGFATEYGGPEGHTAIMARALGLPAVLGVPGLLARARPDARLVVDGSAGTVIIDPTPETVEDYQERHEEYIRERRQFGRLRRLPAITRDEIE